MKITILGAGAWGTAIASICARQSDNQTILWGRNPQTLEIIAKHHHHPKAFPHVKLPENIICESHLETAIEKADIIFSVIPTQNIRDFLKSIKNFDPKTIWVNCSKGLEQEKLELPHRIIKSFHKGVCLSLAGPNFAEEIAQNLPAATVIAGRKEDETSISKVISALKNDQFRPYYHFDQIGLEAACVIKNIIAIAAGISMALKLGENARAALITRGINEMASFVYKFGGNRETVYGLSGIGDMILTSSSLKSRNTTFGYRLGKNEIDINEFIHKGDTGGKTVEGAFNIKAVKQLYPDLDLPITDALYQMIYQNRPIKELLFELFNRPIKSEI